MSKRDIFGELTEGFDALKQSREGKITLQTSDLAIKASVIITAAEIRSLRERREVSRPIFANIWAS